MWRPLLLLLALAALAPAPLAAQTVSGRILDAAGAPAVGATVSLLDAEGAVVQSVRTGADGAYRVTAPAAGTFRIRAEQAEFSLDVGPLTLAAGQDLRYELHMDPDDPGIREGTPVELAPIVATATSENRYARLRREYGGRVHALTAQQIANRRSARHVGDLARGLPGVQVREIRVRQSNFVVGVRMYHQGQEVDVWVDNMRVDPELIMHTRPGDVGRVEFFPDGYQQAGERGRPALMVFTTHYLATNPDV